MTPMEAAAKLLAIEDEISAVRQSLGMIEGWTPQNALNHITLLGYVEQDVNKVKGELAVERRRAG